MVAWWRQDALIWLSFFSFLTTPLWLNLYYRLFLEPNTLTLCPPIHHLHVVPVYVSLLTRLLSHASSTVFVLLLVIFVVVPFPVLLSRISIWLMLSTSRLSGDVETNMAQLILSNVCVTNDDQGDMMQCETCSCWSHCKCVSIPITLAESCLSTLC